jgi:hypothetical protein
MAMGRGRARTDAGSETHAYYPPIRPTNVVSHYTEPHTTSSPSPYQVQCCGMNASVSRQMFDASASARKQPVAAPPQASPGTPVLGSLMGKMLAIFGAGEAASAFRGRAAIAPPHPAKRAQGPVLVAEIPLPPPRPAELAQTVGAVAEAPLQASGQEAEGAGTTASAAGSQAASEAAPAETAETAPLPPRRPGNATLFAMRRIARTALPKLITGAQPILSPDFSAYADMDR